MNYKTKGTHTKIEYLSNSLLQRWIPKWYEAFTDNDFGGVYERVGHSFKPIFVGQRRLITHCRQLSMYSDALQHSCAKNFSPDLKSLFEHIVRTYYISTTGGWLFSVDDDGNPLDTTLDLYALSFVIFSFSHYYKASGDETAAKLSQETLIFIENNFAIAGQDGWAEKLNEELLPIVCPRRHESHMHLLEACIFAAEAWNEDIYITMATQLVNLFLEFFYDEKTGVLSEYFTADLKPLPENGNIILEPGHYCEWIWLLKKYEKLLGDEGRYDGVCRHMLKWANDSGWDNNFGGIYDELNSEGKVIKNTKRIWPIAEVLKANAMMLDIEGIDKVFIKQRIGQMVEIFCDCYMQERGFWTEWLNMDLSSAADYMPGTTPYHVYFGIMETREVLQARGTTKSLTGKFYIDLYTLRRDLSAKVKTVRNKLAKISGG